MQSRECSYVLSGEQVLLPDDRFAAADVEVREGVIGRVQDHRVGHLDHGLPIVRVPTGHFLVPGLIDTHVHGRLGRNAMEATRDAVSAIGAALLASGVTSFVAGTASAPWDQMLASVGGLAELTGPTAGAELLGIHLEGPFLSPSRRGVHRLDALALPEERRIAEVLDVAGRALRICTLAPELPGAMAAVDRLCEAGVQVSLGHTDADFSVASEAVRRGARRATHLFNAMPPIHHRDPGPIPALLSDVRVYLEVVPDGVHVAPELLAVMLGSRDLAGRVVLVSDGSDVGGLPDGPHRRWEGTDVVLRGGRSYTPEGTTAGSASMLIDGIKVAVDAGVPPARALAAASRIPAAALGLRDRGRIAPGARADLLVLTDRFDIDTTILHGTRQVMIGEPRAHLDDPR